MKVGLARKVETSEFDWDSPDYFKGAKIAILRTSSRSPSWQRYLSAGVDFVYVDTNEQALSMVLRDRVDYAAIDLKGLEIFQLASQSGKGLQFSERIVVEFPLGIFVSSRCRGIFGDAVEHDKGAPSKDAPLQNWQLPLKGIRRRPRPP